MDLKIPEGIEEALRSTQPLPLLATEWLRDTAAEVPFIILLRCATRMTKNLIKRRAASAEMATDFVAVLAPGLRHGGRGRGLVGGSGLADGGDYQRRIRLGSA